MADPMQLEARRTIDQLRAERDQLREALGEMVDAVQWMSGSPSFGDEGEGRDHWRLTIRPRLGAAMKLLHPQEGKRG